MINQQSGGTVIAPWEIGQLPEEWLDVFMGLANDLPQYQYEAKAINNAFEKFRKQHPTYRKR